MKRWLTVAALTVLAVAGCKKSSNNSMPVQKYAVRGTILAVDAADGEVSLDGETIPGFMDAMTMSYKVADRAAISELHPGDKIAATLMCEGDAAGCTNMRLIEIVITAQAKPDYKPAMQYHVPQRGDSVPDFKLTNQSAKAIHLDQFKGKVLLVTFVYTRCPLADYCPRMSHNFAQVENDLSGDRSLYKQTHLLTISFDPAYDTPPVLKSYGEAYTGKFTNATFGHWDFAVPNKNEITKVEEWFDLGVQPGDNGLLTHSLSTLIIGKDGKVVAFYPTKDWTVSDAEAQIHKAATT